MPNAIFDKGMTKCNFFFSKTQFLKDPEGKSIVLYEIMFIAYRGAVFKRAYI